MAASSNELVGWKSVDLFWPPQVNPHIPRPLPAIISPQYQEQAQTSLSLYQRVNQYPFSDLTEELSDFPQLPPIIYLTITKLITVHLFPFKLNFFVPKPVQHPSEALPSLEDVLVKAKIHQDKLTVYTGSESRLCILYSIVRSRLNQYVRQLSTQDIVKISNQTSRMEMVYFLNDPRARLREAPIPPWVELALNYRITEAELTRYLRIPSYHSLFDLWENFNLKYYGYFTRGIVTRNRQIYVAARARQPHTVYNLINAGADVLLACYGFLKNNQFDLAHSILDKINPDNINRKSLHKTAILACVKKQEPIYSRLDKFISPDGSPNSRMPYLVILRGMQDTMQESYLSSLYRIDMIHAVEIFLTYGKYEPIQMILNYLRRAYLDLTGLLGQARIDRLYAKMMVSGNKSGAEFLENVAEPNFSGRLLGMAYHRKSPLFQTLLDRYKIQPDKFKSPMDKGRNTLASALIYCLRKRNISFLDRVNISENCFYLFPAAMRSGKYELVNAILSHFSKSPSLYVLIHGIKKGIKRGYSKIVSIVCSDMQLYLDKYPKLYSEMLKIAYEEPYAGQEMIDMLNQMINNVPSLSSPISDDE